LKEPCVLFTIGQAKKVLSNVREKTTTSLESTIVIASHNRWDDLRRTLQRLRSLEPKPLEIIVVLDGCTDGSKEKVAAKFPEISIIENFVKQGSIPSRDTAFRLAKGDIIVSLDDDSYPLQSDFIALVAKLATDHPEAGIFAFREVRSEWPKSHRPLDREGIGHYVSSFANCAGAIRRSLYGNAVHYPRFLSHMYEEPDSCLQAYSAGYAVWYEPSIAIFHDASPLQRNVISRHHLNARNELWSVILRCPLPHCVWVAPYRVLRQFVHAASNGWAWVRKEPLWWISAALGVGQCLRQRQPVAWRIYWNWMNLTRRPVVAYDDVLRRFYTIAYRQQTGNLSTNSEA
jgi:GT2 family glycosyltransferase